jgi:hypothetical protein
VPNHIASELQGLEPPIGVAVDLHVADGAFVLGDAPGLGVRIDEALITAAGHPRAPGSGGPHVRPEQAGRRLLAVTDGAGDGRVDGGAGDGRVDGVGHRARGGWSGR